MEIFNLIFIRNKKLKVYWKENGFLLLKCLMLQAKSLNEKSGRVINILWVTAQSCLLLLKEKRKGNTPRIRCVCSDFQSQRRSWGWRWVERALNWGSGDQFVLLAWIYSSVKWGRGFQGSGHMSSLLLKDSDSVGLGEPPRPTQHPGVRPHRCSIWLG